MRIPGLMGCIIIFAFIVLSSNGYCQEPLFPQIPDWKITQDDPVYTSNNLWDIIDGAADLYLEYAFVDLHIARYINTDSIEVKVELYRHASDVDAFGMYSQERDTGYHFIPLGVQGYIQQGVLNFLTGCYYIKLSTYQTGEKAQEALSIIGGRLEEHLKQHNAIPKLFTVFPTARKLLNTEQYVARNFLGYRFLNSAYMTTYKDSSAFKIFLLELATPEKAHGVISEYFKVIPKGAVTQLAADTYQVQDPNNGAIGLLVFDRYLCGIMNCPNSITQDLYLKKITANLVR
jgi:hypothetical protein